MVFLLDVFLRPPEVFEIIKAFVRGRGGRRLGLARPGLDRMCAQAHVECTAAQLTQQDALVKA